MEEPDIWVIDFEGSRSLGVVEIGLVQLRGRQIVSTWTELFRPLSWEGFSALRMTGIARGDLADRPSFEERFDRLRDCRRSGPFCAHNASFENNLLARTWPYPGMVANWSRDDRAEEASWGPWLDTCTLARGIRYPSDNYKLETLVTAAGLTNDVEWEAEQHCPEDRRGWHRALYDALASALLLVHLRDKLPGQTLPMLFRHQKARRRDWGQLFLL